MTDTAGGRKAPTPDQARLDAIQEAYDDSTCDACGEFHPELFLEALQARLYNVDLFLALPLSSASTDR